MGEAAVTELRPVASDGSSVELDAMGVLFRQLRPLQPEQRAAVLEVVQALTVLTPPRERHGVHSAVESCRLALESLTDDETRVRALVWARGSMLQQPTAKAGGKKGSGK